MFEPLIKAIQKSVETQTLNIEGYSYTTNPIHPVTFKRMEPIRLNTLEGICSFYEKQGKSVPDGAFIINSINQVSFVDLGNCYEPGQERDIYAIAEVKNKCFPLEKYIPQEEFSIFLQQFFVPSRGDIGELLQQIGNVVATSEITMNDDGVSQAVSTRSSLKPSGEKKALLNPVQLAPYSTFPEIEQPLYTYIVRMRKEKDGVLFALFPTADLSENRATIARIHQYLSNSSSATVLM